MTSLRALPVELARLVTAFLTLGDLVVLVGSVGKSARRSGLQQFLPAEHEIDALVPDSRCCLRSERRRQHKGRPPPSALAACRAIASDGAAAFCVYHNPSLRVLLLQNDEYARLARRKLDATEALQHLGVKDDDHHHHDDTAAALRQRVAIDILDTQRRRRQLNRHSLAQTLAFALIHSLHAVVEWIRVEPLAHLPAASRWSVLLACCEHDDVAVALGVMRQLAGADAAAAARHSPVEGGRVLVAASRRGRPEVVRYALGVVCTASPVAASTLEAALAAAAESGHVAVLELLICTAEAHAFVLDAAEALSRACQRARAAAVAALLSLPSQAISFRPAGHAAYLPGPLVAAVDGGDPTILASVLRDARVNAWSPLALQRAACLAKPAMLSLLLEHPRCQPNDVDVALHCVARSLDPQANTKPSDVSAVVRCLLERVDGAAIDDGSAWELVDLLCVYGDVDALGQLLRRCALAGNGNGGDRKYWRPLVTAARHGHVDVVRRILEPRGDRLWSLLSMEKALDSETEAAEALLAACHHDHLVTAQLLLPLVSAELVQLLRVVEAAAAAPTCDVLQWLLAADSNTAAAASDLDAALQYACAHGRTPAARLLLRHPRVRFADGLSIQFAATSGAVELVALLLGDARVSAAAAAAYDLEAALVDASREGHAAVVELLLGDDRLRITSGAAVHEAADRGHLDVIKLLLASPLAWAGTLALDLQVAFTRAARRGHYAVVLHLLNDRRVPLPLGGALSRVEDLPRRPGDARWCVFLRRFFCHPRVDPAADDCQLLLDACVQAKRGVVDALVRSGRVAVDATIVETVDDLARLATASAAAQTRFPAHLARRYPLIAADLRSHRETQAKPQRAARLLAA